MLLRWFYFRLGKCLSLPIFYSYSRLNFSYHWSFSRQIISYSRPKLSDFYTLSQTKLVENHTLHSGTYPYSLYMRVPPPPPQSITHVMYFSRFLSLSISTVSTSCFFFLYSINVCSANLSVIVHKTFCSFVLVGPPNWNQCASAVALTSYNNHRNLMSSFVDNEFDL